MKNNKLFKLKSSITTNKKQKQMNAAPIFYKSTSLKACAKKKIQPIC